MVTRPSVAVHSRFWACPCHTYKECCFRVSEFGDEGIRGWIGGSRLGGTFHRSRRDEWGHIDSHNTSWDKRWITAWRLRRGWRLMLGCLRLPVHIRLMAPILNCYLYRNIYWVFFFVYLFFTLARISEMLRNSLAGVSQSSPTMSSHSSSTLT